MEKIFNQVVKLRVALFQEDVRVRRFKHEEERRFRQADPDNPLH